MRWRSLSAGSRGAAGAGGQLERGCCAWGRIEEVRKRGLWLTSFFSPCCWFCSLVRSSVCSYLGRRRAHMGCMPSLSVGVLWNLPAPPSWEPTGGVAGRLEHAETGNRGGRLLKLVGICGGYLCIIGRLAFAVFLDNWPSRRFCQDLKCVVRGPPCRFRNGPCFLFLAPGSGAKYWYRKRKTQMGAMDPDKPHPQYRNCV